MNESIDNLTLEQFQKGDQHAFLQIFNKYYSGLHYFTQKLTSSHEEGEDIALRTFQKLFERCALFTTEANIKAFLYITARNNSFDYLRFIKWQDEKQREFATKMQNEKLLQYEYEINDELIDMVIAAIERLPEECRKIFKLLYFDNLKPAEIAELLKISVNTVYVQKGRAIQSLRLLLADNSMALMWLLCTIAYLQHDILSKISLMAG